MNRKTSPNWKFTDHLVLLIFVMMAIYSFVLITIELNTSQEFVRNFFTDIDGPVPFYAVNTTISVALLWATSLMFAVCLAVIDSLPVSARLRWFLLSQVLMFGFLGVDDRFKFHEVLAARLGFDDHYVLLTTALLEVGLLWRLGGKQIVFGPPAKYLAIAAALFGVMIVIDALVPSKMLLRLSLEDLAKTWAAMFFFLFAWNIFSACLRCLRLQRTDLF